MIIAGQVTVSIALYDVFRHARFRTRWYCFVLCVVVLFVAPFVAWKLTPRQKAEATGPKINTPDKPGESQMRGLLIPGNDPTPPNPCGETPPGEIAIYIGDMAATSPSASLVVLQVGQENLLELEKTNDGLVINAAIYTPDNREVARITRNAIRVTPASGYYAERPDPHTLVILDPEDQKALYVRYLNPTAVKILGIFYYKRALWAVFDDNEQHIGVGSFSNFCVRMFNARVLFNTDYPENLHK